MTAMKKRTNTPPILPSQASGSALSTLRGHEDPYTVPPEMEPTHITNHAIHSWAHLPNILF